MDTPPESSPRPRSRPRLDYRRIRTARTAAFALSGWFGLWAAGLLLLAVTVPTSPAFPERIGYAAVCCAGALALLVVWWLIGRAVDTGEPTRTDRAVERVRIRLSTPRH